MIKNKVFKVKIIFNQKLKVEKKQTENQ